MAKDQTFVPQITIYKILILHQYLKTVAMLLFSNLTAILGELNELILIKNCQRIAGANSKQLDHCIIRTLVDNKPDVVLLCVGTNDIISKSNDTELANNIINFGLNCKNHGVIKVFISSILVKKYLKLNPII